MAEDRDQRTEQPTEKRLRESREKGQVARSRDLSGALVLTVATATLGVGTLTGLAGWLRSGIEQAGHPDQADLPLRLAALAVTPFQLLSGTFIAMVVAAVLGQLALGGWNLSAKAMAPDFGRLSPANNLRRMFTSGPVELGKTPLKAVVVGAAVYAFVRTRQGTLHTLALAAPEPAARAVLGFALGVLAAGCGGLLLVALIDVPWQWWKHRRDLRMSKQELRDEARETEGRPEVKARLRKLQQQLGRGRMIEAVKGADVVIVNPIHVAVALQYAPGSMKAPKVVAKGAGVIAEQIRDAARRERVPILTLPPLARALYRTTRLDGDVPVVLYRAVAQILAWVYQLRNGNAAPLPDVALPDSLAQAARPWT